MEEYSVVLSQLKEFGLRSGALSCSQPDLSSIGQNVLEMGIAGVSKGKNESLLEKGKDDLQCKIACLGLFRRSVCLSF